VPIEERERLLLKAGLDPAELANLTLVYQNPLTQVCFHHVRAVLVCRPPSVARVRTSFSTCTSDAHCISLQM